MACEKFRTQGTLYLSGELRTLERIRYEKHLERCPECAEQLQQARAIWNLCSSLNLDVPESRTREGILRAAQRTEPHKPAYRIPFDRKYFGRIERTVVWSLALAACFTAAFLIQQQISFRNGLVSRTAWNDLFYADADWIQNELKRIQSGSLLTYYSQSEALYDVQSPEEAHSSLSEEFTQIRGDVDELENSLEGI